MNRKAHGFTIVELLIVIVVIAILAAISIAAYTNIQNRANDSAVKSDLAQFAKQIQLIYAEKGEYPAGGQNQSASGASVTGNATTFPGFSFKFSREAYFPQSSNPNIIYCTGPDATSGEDFFRIAARSKSGTSFAYESNGGSVKEYPTGAYPAGGCAGIGYPRSSSWGIAVSGAWYSWTK